MNANFPSFPANPTEEAAVTVPEEVRSAALPGQFNTLDNIDEEAFAQALADPAEEAKRQRRRLILLKLRGLAPYTYGTNAPEAPEDPAPVNPGYGYGAGYGYAPAYYGSHYYPSYYKGTKDQTK